MSLTICGKTVKLTGKSGDMIVNSSFWKEKKVLITGHTGFKGSWLSLMLHKLGAGVFGYALDPPTNPGMFNELRIDDLITSFIGDIRDLSKLMHAVNLYRPELIFHMAAQPLVRESYKDPVATYETNVIGTVNLLETVRRSPGVKAVVIVTSDKCYENKEWHWGYRENDPVGGYDPYSNSKACTELVTTAFRNSFFNANEYMAHGVALASARAGNVIGGGDWAEDRLIPDFIRAIKNGEEVRIRSPFAIRPWQHVLEPLTGYMSLAEKLYNDGPVYAGPWNFGPEDTDARNVDYITKRFAEFWGDGFSFVPDIDPQPHEASFLKLDCSKAKAKLGWVSLWDIDQALKHTVEWYKAWINKEDLMSITENQIAEYFQDTNN